MPLHKLMTLLVCLSLGVFACAAEEEDDDDDDDDDEDEESAAQYESFESLSTDVCDPATGTFSADIDNPYFPLPVGQQATLSGEDDEGVTIRVQITVLDQIEQVAGVDTRVVEEAEWEDGEQIEISLNYYAQASDATVCYFGEQVDIIEDGEVTAHDGSWRADDSGNAPGIMMPGDPGAGVKYAQESAPGVAEDMSAITSLGDAVSTPAGDYTDTVRAFDWNPLEGGEGDVKYYARGVGLVVDAEAELTQLRAP
jgi:hypothetical protein